MKRVTRQSEQADNVGYLDGLTDGETFRSEMEPHPAYPVQFNGGELDVEDR